MPCPSENLLLDAIDGRITASERSDIDSHVAGCVECRELVDSALNATNTLIESTDSKARKIETPTSDPLLGSTVGEYVVEQMIGSGGMGIVYRGSHPVIGKPVAIKILRPELAANAGHMRRMLSEARAIGSIAHRSIVDVFAFGELADGRQYMVMEFLQGEPLNQIIRTQAPMPSWKLLPLLDGILEALVASHLAGVIHRDLKPSNLYVVQQADGSRFVKLLDFGLAKREVDDQGHTRAGRVVMGTPGYMAPEQIRAEAVGPVSDLYPLGVIAYELATGKRPFRGRNALEVMRLQVEAEPAPPSKLAPDLPPELEALILSLMAKAPADRPESADAVRQAIKRMMSAEPSRRQTQSSVKALKLPSPPRTWQLVVGGAAVAAIALSGIVAWLVMNRPPIEAPRPIEPAPRPVELARPIPPEAPDASIAAGPEPEPPPPVISKGGHSPRLTQKTLLERTRLLRRKLAKATPRGDEPDPMLTMLISNAEKDTRSARGEAELKKIATTLADIERKYFKR